MRKLEYFSRDAQETISNWPKKLKTRVLDQLRELQLEQSATRNKPWHGNEWMGFEITTSGVRVVGTLEDPTKVIVFHAFRKDSKKGKKTRQLDVDRIEERHRRWLNEQPRTGRLH